MYLLLTSAAILAVLMGGPVAAQTVTGTVQGTVTDTSGGTLPGVIVTLRNMETGVERTVVTNAASVHAQR